jgi:hypothetical protein
MVFPIPVGVFLEEVFSFLFGELAEFLFRA